MTAAVPPSLDEAPGFLARVRGIVHDVATRLRGEVVAGDPPGEMTGVTEEQKARAAAEGTFIPLHEFTLPADAVAEILRKAEEAQKQRAEESGAPK